VSLSMIPSPLQSISLTTAPCPISFPRDPILSTPTKISPEADTARQAGLGTKSGPAKTLISSFSGHSNLAARESVMVTYRSSITAVQFLFSELHADAKNVTASINQYEYFI